VPPVAKLRAAGVRMAVATDLNPGSSHCETLPIQMWLATTHFGMSVEEAWLGVTRHAAAALGVADAGTLVTGARADFVVWRCSEPAHVPYRYGTNLVETVCVDGVLVER
jgi:imidazolonepropionase